MGRKIEMKGKQFGHLTVIEEAKERVDGQVAWVCRCVCGSQITVRGKCLRNGETKSCGCKKSELVSKSRHRDLQGQKFGRLTVIREHHKESEKYYWLCKCDCGNEVIVNASNLTSGNSKSCGCYNSEKREETKTTHGMYGTRLYIIWNNMKNRCLDENIPRYGDYGGRGIKICEEWKKFENFQKWALENGYSDDLTIDRMNNEGNYEPSNCRWTNIIEQANNKRNNLLLTYKGKTKTLSEWCRELNLKYHFCYDRLLRGWRVEDTFEIPPIK